MKRHNVKDFRFGRVRLRFLHVIIWAMALAAVAALFHERNRHFEIVGFARPDTQIIRATGDGRLSRVHVNLFGKVEKGQSLAVLQLNTIHGDDSFREELIRRRATANAELQRLRLEIDAARENLKSAAANRETRTTATYRGLAVDVEQAKLSELELLAIIEPDKILLKDMLLEIEITQNLVNKGALDEYDLKKLHVQHDALASKIKENQNLLQMAGKNHTEAERRFDEFARQETVALREDAILDPIRQAIIVQEGLINEMRLQRADLPIIAPFDAIVSLPQSSEAPATVDGKMAMEGDVVMKGDPIFTIVRAEPVDIIAYANPEEAKQLHVNKKVQLIKRTRPQRVAESQITRIGPSIEMLPQRLWKNPDMPEYGLPVLIACNPDIGLLPNELVGIRGL